MSASPGFRGRFAPSPTGELHFGNARTALLGWLQARAAGGCFVVRVEDIDTPRVVPGSMDRQLESLKRLGLDWDEGPEVGGPYGPYWQSERLPLYEAALARLEAEGRLFPCFCSRAEIARLASAPHGPDDDGPPYPGTCRDLSPAEREARAAQRRPSWRFRVLPGEVGWVDGVRGPSHQEVQQAVGDVVLRRGDGIHAYQLAVVVDDAAMAITHVLRAADLTGSTARQIQLFEALGAPVPAFAHVPLVLGPSGEKLSKRELSQGVLGLLEGGLSPGRLLRALAESCGLPAERLDPERATPERLVEGFSLASIPREPVRWSGLIPRDA